jgi:hypothetical protein
LETAGVSTEAPAGEDEDFVEEVELEAEAEAAESEGDAAEEEKG